MGPSEAALQDVDQAAGDVVAVGEDSHLQGSVSAAGEDAVSRTRLHLHHSGTDVAEDRLLGVFGAKRVHEPMTGQLPDLERIKHT